jgi:hypothetical protein
MNVFLENFGSRQDVLREFNITEDSLRGYKILLAWYGYGSYDGAAFVLFSRGRKLYEVNGSHCSCYGLEDQWSPEETSAEALMHRINEGSLGRDTYTSGGTFGDQLKEVLQQWKG